MRAKLTPGAPSGVAHHCMRMRAAAGRALRPPQVLQDLADGPNVVRLLDVVRDPDSKTPSLIFEFLDHTGRVGMLI